MKIQVIPMRSRRPPWALSGIGGLAMMLALGLAPSAQAGNIAPNSSFELDCGGLPCNWTVNTSAGTITRDTSTAHSGQASLEETSDAVGTPGALSDWRAYRLSRMGTVLEAVAPAGTRVANLSPTVMRLS